MSEEIVAIKTQDAVVIVASGSDTSDQIDFSTKSLEGYFSLQVALTGDGTGKIEYELSNDGVNFLTPSEAADIATAFLKTTGPDSDGNDILSFTPMVTKHLKIKVTETGGVSSITVTTTFVYQ